MPSFSSVGFFWLFVGFAFLIMAYQTWRVRETLVPKSIEKARKEAYFAGDDVSKLKPIYDETLRIEVLALALSGIAALFSFLMT
jgi:hypothetical protein